MKLNDNERKVLEALIQVAGEGCLSFAGVSERVEINHDELMDRAIIRRACRSLARKGLAEFHRGLWSDDGEPAGSGYGATKAGCDALTSTLCEPGK